MSEPTEEQSTPQSDEGQVSEAGSSFDDAEAANGGADAVPDTPDINPGTPAAMQDGAE